MFRSGRTSFVKKHVDSLSREIARQSAENRVEAERVLASPYLFAKVRSRIESRAGTLADRDSWITTLGVFWRAVPSMALVAVIALILFLSSALRPEVRAGLSDDSVLGERDPGITAAIFADSRSMTNDDVLETILDRDDQEGAK
jgi:hypothetical protein